MKEMLLYLRPYRKMLVLSSLAVGVSTMCDLILPTIMSDILNHGVYLMDFAYIVKCCSVMFLVALIGLGAVILGSKISSDVVASFCVRALIPDPDGMCGARFSGRSMR